MDHDFTDRSISLWTPTEAIDASYYGDELHKRLAELADNYRDLLYVFEDRGSLETQIQELENDVEKIEEYIASTCKYVTKIFYKEMMTKKVRNDDEYYKESLADLCVTMDNLQKDIKDELKDIQIQIKYLKEYDDEIIEKANRIET